MKQEKEDSSKKVVLKLEDVSKIYSMGQSKLSALDKINLSVKKGEFICILGPSGSGKSTLLHIIGLLDTPTSGLRYVDGIETSKIPEYEQARIRGKKIGFVFQRFNLIPSLSAVENVELPLVISSDKNSRREKAAKILKSLNMGERLDHYPSQLSGGQTQRVAIARALVNDPEIILADEPTGNLDSKTGKEVLEIFSTLHQQGRTIIIITHDESITKHAQRVVLIKDGKLYSQ